MVRVSGVDIEQVAGVSALAAAPAAATIQVYTLGGFRVVQHGKRLTGQARRSWRGSAARELFKYLISVPSHRLTDGAAVPAGRSWREAAAALRAVFEDPDLIEIADDGVALRQDAGLWVDADAFEDLLAQASGESDPSTTIRQALDLYRGTYLPRNRVDVWAQARREQLARAHTDSLRQLAELDEQRGNVEQAIRSLERLVRSNPDDQPAAEALLRLRGSERRAPPIAPPGPHADERAPGIAQRAARNDRHVARRVATELRDRPLPTGTVTFLLSDIESSTRLWESDPSGMRRALILHDALIERSVARNAGTIVRPRGEGDSRFAVFARATDGLACAIEVQLAFEDARWPLSEPLRIRIALHTGDAELREDDYYGSAINRCARLRGLAMGGQVLLSEVTAHQAQAALVGDASLKSLGSHTLRDLVQPEHIYQLVHPSLRADFPPIVDAPPIVRALVRPIEYTPAYPFPQAVKLVGRELELDQVLDSIAGQESERGATVFIGAPAGTGKSTLLGAAVQHLQQRAYLCLAGEFLESGGVVPLRALAQAIGDYLSNQSAAELRAELADVIADLTPLVPELRYQVRSIDQNERQSISQERLFGAIVSFFRALAARHPTVVCLENLHAADAATLDLLALLADLSHRIPLSIIGTYRDDELQTGHAFAPILTHLTREGATSIALPPLERGHVQELGQALLGGPTSEELDDALFRVSKGNPLFLEQLILTLRAEHRIDRRRGVWDQTEDISGTVPPLVRDVILLRLERLSARTRKTLAVAAVIGPRVEHQILKVVCAEPEPELVDDLDELLGDLIIREDGAGYVFSHALLRDSLYASLTRPRRSLLHAQIGRAIEQFAIESLGSTSRYAAELAHHFTHGGSDPFVRKAALKYTIEAGQHAADLSLHRQALAYFDQADGILEESPAIADDSTRMDVLEGRGVAERSLGDWSATVEHYSQILAIATDPIQRARARGAISRALQQLGNVPEAQAASEAALNELADTTDRDAEIVRLNLLYHRAFFDMLAGKYAHVVRTGEQVLGRAETLDEPRIVLLAHSVVALGAMCSGDAEKSRAHFEAAREGAETLPDRTLLAMVLENFGSHYYQFGDLDAACDMLEQALAMHHESTSELKSALALHLLSRVRLARGEVEVAFTLAQQAVAAVRGGQDRWLGKCLTTLAGVHGMRGEWPSARALLSEALEVYDRIPQAEATVEALLGLGFACAQTGEDDAAERSYRRALEITRTMDPGPFAITSLRSFGTYLLQQDKVAEGAQYIQEALDLAATMSVTLEHAPAFVADAMLRSLEGDRHAAVSSLQRAFASPRTAECSVRAYALSASLSLADGDTAAAVEHSARAIGLAESIGSPWLVDLARGNAGMVFTARPTR